MTASPARRARWRWWLGLGVAAVLLTLLFVARPGGGGGTFPPLDLRAELTSMLEPGPGETAGWPQYEEVQRRLAGVDTATRVEVLQARPGDDSWSTARSFVEQHEETIAMLQEATACDVYGNLLPPAPGGAAVCPGSLELLATYPFPHFDGTRRLANLLCLAAEVAIEDGDPARAVDLWIAAAGLGSHLDRRPMLIDHMIGQTISVIAGESLVPHLMRSGRDWPDELLDRIEGSAFCESPVVPIEERLAGEWLWVRAVMRVVFDDGSGQPGRMQGHLLTEIMTAAPPGSPGSLWEKIEGTWRATRHAGYAATWRELQKCRDDALAAAGAPDAHRALEALSTANERYTGFWDSGRYLLVRMLDPIQRVRGLVKGAAELHARRHAHRILVALLRFQREHGRWPDRLTELPADLVAGLPKEPADGGPLVYRTTPDGDFVLYWTGWDGVDQSAGRATGGADDRFFVPWQ